MFITWRFNICFRILWFLLNFMISSEDISAPQRLNCSLDIFFILGILLRKSKIQLLKFAWCRVFLIFLQIEECLSSILIYYHYYVTQILFQFAYSVFQVLSRKFWTLFLPSSSCVMLAQTLAPFTCLFSNWFVHFVSFQSMVWSLVRNFLFVQI